jgi:hypothetical protein
VSPETIKNRSSTSGGVRYTVPVNGISSEEAMRFGLGNTNPGYKMMRDMGGKGGPLGKLNSGIATALTGKSIGGQTNKSGIGSQQQFDSRASVVRRNNNLQEHESRRDQDRRSRRHQSKQSKPVTTGDVRFVCRLTTEVEKGLTNKRKRFEVWC